MVLDSLRRDSSNQRHEDALEFGLLFGLVAAAMATQAAAAWTVRSAHRYLPEALSSPYLVSYVAVYVVGTALLALAYSWLRDVQLPRTLPTTSELPIVAATVFAPAVAVGTVAAVGHTFLDVTITEMLGIVYAPAVDPSYLLHRAGTLAVSGGIGLGLLVNGAAQGSLRERIDPDHAVVVAAGLGGVYYGADAIAGNLLFSPAPLLTLIVVVAIAVGLGVGAGTLYRPPLTIDGSSRRRTRSRSSPYSPEPGFCSPASTDVETYCTAVSGWRRSALQRSATSGHARFSSRSSLSLRCCSRSNSRQRWSRCSGSSDGSKVNPQTCIKAAPKLSR